MKKFLLLSLFSISFCAFGQDKFASKSTKDEVKINALQLIAGAFEVGYEHVLNEESAFGVSLFVPITDNFDTNFMVTPYYRYYFGAKPASGFFMEGFGSLNSMDDTITVSETANSVSFYSTKNKTITDFAFGIGLGGKWISKKGVTFELNLGVGRNLFSKYNDNDYDRSYEVIGRVGATVGYRF